MAMIDTSLIKPSSDAVQAAHDALREANSRLVWLQRDPARTAAQLTKAEAEIEDARAVYLKALYNLGAAVPKIIEGAERLLQESDSVPSTGLAKLTAEQAQEWGGLLHVIEHAETQSMVARGRARADGFLLGLRAAKVIDEVDFSELDEEAASVETGAAISTEAGRN